MASGPSAADVPLEIAETEARFIAVNDSWKLAPWASLLFASDYAWWKSCDGCVAFRGVKLCADDRARKEWPDLHLVNVQRVDRLEVNDLGTIGSGGNSGFQAFNVAIQTGSKKIILVGFDMTIQNGAHWHGPHPAGMNNPQKNSLGRWRRSLDMAAGVVSKLGVKVINASPVSALTAYPKMSLAEALV